MKITNIQQLIEKLIVLKQEIKSNEKLLNTFSEYASFLSLSVSRMGEVSMQDLIGYAVLTGMLVERENKENI